MQRLGEHRPPRQVALPQEEGGFDQRLALLLRNWPAQNLCFKHVIDKGLCEAADLCQSVGRSRLDGHNWSFRRSFTPGSPPLVNSTPAVSRARLIASALAAVIPNGPSCSSARRTVATPIREASATSWAV